MVFDKSCYKSGDSYHSWKTQLKNHQRVSYNSIPELNENFNELEEKISQIEYINNHK